jgi:hypothetical protein
VSTEEKTRWPPVPVWTFCRREKYPPGRRKRGRPKLTWTEGIRRLMGEKGLIEEDRNDRSNWRKKII